MMYKLEKARKKAYTFMKSDNKFIDTSDPEIVEEMEKKNPSLLYYIYLKNGEKEKAIELLKKGRRSKHMITQINEIIYAYLYFGDYEGAMEYIESYKGTIPEIIPTESLIKIYLERKNSSCKDNGVFIHAATGIKACFDRRMIEIVIDFYKNACGDCFHTCLAKKFREIEILIMENHYEKLSYDDARYLYKIMPNKAPFLKRMVETNPFIKKKYYFEYANHFGIQKEDIQRILAVRTCPWALVIAIFYGWVDESFKTIFDKDTQKYPLRLNADGDWNWNFDSLINFSKKYNKKTDEKNS